MGQRILIRKDTAANWAGSNIALLNGELGYDINGGLLKIGNGVSLWPVLKQLTERRVTFVNPLAVSGDLGVGVTNYKIINASIRLKAKVAANGYAIGDTVNAFVNPPCVWVASNGQTFRTIVGTTLPSVLPKAGGAAFITTAANWELVVTLDLE